MATNQSTIVAVFHNRSDAEKAANDLKSNGFSSNDVYVGSYADASGAGTSREWSATQHHEGGIKGWFKSMFGGDESDEYRDYEYAANQGGVIVSVQADETRIERAAKILEDYGPIDISEQSAGAATAQVTGANPAVTASTAAAAGSTAGTRSTGAARGATNVPEAIPVIAEDLRVGKRSVLRGGVRVYSRVVETPVEETVQLREERVRVDRQPVNRPVTAGDLKAGTEQVFEVEEYAEEPVVQKQARVVEEVRVSKDVSQRNETIRDTVRHSEVQIEDLGQGENYNDDFRRDFQTRYAKLGGNYEDYAPAYAYGYQAASDPRYQGRSWDEIESDLRTNYGRQYPNSTWEKMKDSVRYGWGKVTGKSRSAAASGSATTHGD